MTLCEKGRPKFPDVEAQPGLYELSLDNGWIYYGQAKDLRSRLANYCSGKTGLVQEQRLHEALREAGGAGVKVFVNGDLTENATRCMLESQAIDSARSRGLKVLNATRAGDPYCIELDIRFHQEQITKLRSKLEQLRRVQEQL